VLPRQPPLPALTVCRPPRGAVANRLFERRADLRLPTRAIGGHATHRESIICGLQAGIRSAQNGYGVRQRVRYTQTAGPATTVTVVRLAERVRVARLYIGVRNRRGASNSGYMDAAGGHR